MKVPFVGLKRVSNLQNALPLYRGLKEERNQQLLEARPCAATGKIMKAVLCLWAREHLKGRPGPGSGLALLLKKLRRKKKRNNTLLCVCACMCVWQRAAKQDSQSWQRHSKDQTQSWKLRREEKTASPPSHLTAPAGTTGGQASLPEPPRKDFSPGFSSSTSVWEWRSLYLQPSAGLLPGRHLSRRWQGGSHRSEHQGLGSLHQCFH